MSDADQPTLEYFLETVNPGVPAGTMIAEICGRPLTGPPVTAATVTTPVISVPAVRDEGFRAVDHPLPALADGPSLDRAGVRTPARLGEPEGGEELPAAQRGEPALFLLLGAETVDAASSRAPTPAASVIATDESTRASSSMARQSAI